MSSKKPPFVETACSDPYILDTALQKMTGRARPRLIFTSHSFVGFKDRPGRVLGNPITSVLFFSRLLNPSFVGSQHSRPRTSTLQAVQTKFTRNVCM